VKRWKILYISRCFEGRGVWLSLAMRLAKEGRVLGGPGAWEGRRGGMNTSTNILTSPDEFLRLKMDQSLKMDESIPQYLLLKVM
jgi:hypothetical protein